MKKLRIILTSFAFLFAIVAAFSSYSADQDALSTAWFKVNENTGALIVPYVQLSEPISCQTVQNKFCAAQYSIDGSGNPDTEAGPIQVREDGRLIGQ